MAPNQYLLDAVVAQRDAALNEAARLAAELRQAQETIRALMVEKTEAEAATDEPR
ncbi:MAG: hypothetical protein NUW01_17475 [Gemmatimonadaceae bacterium]|nr:hypothetical protein [Gemmatimonadaceae bacterium]